MGMPDPNKVPNENYSLEELLGRPRRKILVTPITFTEERISHEKILPFFERTSYEHYLSMPLKKEFPDLRTREMALRRAYAAEYKEGFTFLDNCGAQEVDEKVAGLHTAGLDVVVNEQAFDILGNPLNREFCDVRALLVRPRQGKHLADALYQYYGKQGYGSK